jgi:hypothetical protein
MTARDSAIELPRSGNRHPAAQRGDAITAQLVGTLPATRHRNE